MRASNFRIAVLLVLGVALSYWSLTPGSPGSFHQMPEKIAKTERVLSPQTEGGAPVHQVTPDAQPSGGLGRIVRMPFVLVANLFSSSPEVEDLVLAMEPVILSTLIVLLVYLWSARLTGDRFRAVGFALLAAFCTMLWPYAYIGMELQQSLFLFAAAFLALEGPWHQNLGRWLAFSLCCGLAVSLKPSSVLLLPAVGFLLLRRYQREAAHVRAKRLVTSLAIMITMFVFNVWTGVFSSVSGGFLEESLVSDPFAWWIHVVALLSSPGKGLIVYVPLAMIAVAGIHRARELQADLVIFTVLALGGLVLGLASVIVWSDETWGPRHLHALVGPLVLILASSRRPEERLRPLTRMPLFAAALLGFCVSFLGAFFPYDALQRAAFDSGQSTLQTIQMNPTWNHVKFNARLFSAWVASQDGTPAYWKPAVTWYYERSEWALDSREVRLDRYATPHALLIRKWGEVREPGWISVLVSLMLGPGLILYCLFAAKRNRSATNDRLPDSGHADREHVHPA